MQVEFRVGPQALADGAQVPPRLGRQGGVIVSAGHPDYYEPAYRTTLGELTSFQVSTGSAGVAPGTALSTTPPMALWNPPNSGKNLIVIRTQLGYVSGTLGLAQLWYAKVDVQATVPTGGTTLSPQTSVIGNTASGAGKAYQGSTLASTPVALGPSQFNWGPYAGAGATINVTGFDDLRGSIIVQPGGVFVMQAIGAAGTTPLMLFRIDWLEEKI